MTPIDIWVTRLKVKVRGAYVSIDISCFISLPVSKNIKGINTKLGIHVLAHYDKVQLPVKGHNFESYIFELCPHFN